jgi:uncharacterized coiled-coil protein SlyX
MTFVRSSIVAVAALALLAGGRGAAADQSYVSFTDPLERAFVLDLPTGWPARGGMFRLGYSDYRLMIALRSADGESDIRLGDVAVPSYALPTSTHGEGEPDDLGAQAQLIFARYRSGGDYATLYALTRFKKSCTRLVPLKNAWKPVVGGKGVAGSVTFRCDGSGGTRTAFVYAKTLNQPPLWQVTSLVSFLAPANRVASVEAIIAHAASTFKLEPAWIAYQQKMDAQGLRYQVARQRERMAELGQQVAAFQSRMHAMQDQVNAFERGQSARQAQFEGFDNAINGITPTTDPLDGETRDVWTGPHNGYWVNGSGTIVNSANSPGSGYRQLQPL